MTDIIDYQPPMGLLGAFANRLVIKKRVNEIFTFRTKKLEEYFGKFS
jgi:ligand-binding SRPBCC domain-containing protein